MQRAQRATLPWEMPRFRRTHRREIHDGDRFSTRDGWWIVGVLASLSEASVLERSPLFTRRLVAARPPRMHEACMLMHDLPRDANRFPTRLLIAALALKAHRVTQEKYSFALTVDRVPTYPCEIFAC